MTPPSSRSVAVASGVDGCLVRFTRRPGRRVTGLSVLAVTLLSAAASAQDLPATTYTTVDGLPHDSVARVLPDPRGFLWIGGSSTLARFDGHSFVTYGTADGLDVGTTVNALTLDDRGNLWIATNGGGIYRFDTATTDRSVRFTQIRIGEGRASNRVNVLVHGADGLLWAGTDAGLYTGRIGEEFRRLTLPLTRGAPQEAVQVFGLAIDTSGIWIGTPAGLYHCGPPVSDDCSAGPRIGTRSLLFDHNGDLWIGSERGLYIWRPDAGEAPRTVARGMQVNLLTATADGVLAGTNDGRVLLATETGVRVLHAFADAAAVNEVVEDDARNLWIATQKGLTTIRRQGLTLFGSAHGVHGSSVRALRQHRSGWAYAVSDQYWIHRIEGDRLTARALPFPPGAVRSAWPFTTLLVDGTGDVWLGTASGLYHYGGGAPPQPTTTPLRLRAHYTQADGLAGEHVGELFEDSRGDIWIATVAFSAATLTRFDRDSGRFHPLGEAHGLPAFNQPMAFTEDRTGAVWAGLREGGVVRLREDRATVYGPADGFPPLVWATLADERGALWFGGTDALVRIDSADEEPVRASSVLAGFGGRVVALADAGGGRIATGTTNGLFVIDGDGRVHRLSRYEGLPPGPVEALVREGSGSLLMIVATKLARWTPVPSSADRTIRTLIGGVRARERRLDVPATGTTQVDAQELPASSNQIEIEFLGLSPRVGETLRYETRLLGASDQWTATAERRAAFVGLAPGAYAFEARASGTEGPPSEAARVVFTVLPPWYRRWWFLTALAGIAVLAAYGAHRARLAEAIRNERLRATIATDLHDDIGSSLSQIAIMAEVARRRAGEGTSSVAEPLASIASTSRDLVDSMSDIVWAVSPRADSLGDVTHRMRRFAEETLGGADIALTFSAPAEQLGLKIPPDFRRELYLVVKESVNNIARHSGATSATIELGLAQRELRLTVADDGHGFDVSGPVDGHGIASMRKRAAAVGGQLTITSAPGKGTTVRLSARLDQRRGTYASA
jgi:signal transduction histidine kinase/ligand-binding sensor domain-containing protein